MWKTTRGRAWWMQVGKAVGIGVLAVVSSACESGSQPVVQALDEILDPAVDAVVAPLVGEEVPGLAVLVVHDGRVLHRAGYGVTSPGGEGMPVDLHTPFYIASTGKMFTAAAVLALVDEGRLGLDEPIGSYLPAVPSYARDVTAGQLLTHTSGFVDYYDIGGEDRTYSNAEVFDILHAADGLRFEPGTRAAYSNSGYVLLSLLVEEVSGLSLAEFLDRRFFGPLGMADAFVATDPARRPDDRAIGHHRAADGFEPLDYESTTTGPGGVYASLADLEAWYRGMREGRVLSDSTLRMARRPPELPEGRLTPYGMGWLAEFAARGPLADRWYVFAMGSLRGHRAAFKWYEEDDLLVVWLANSDSGAVIDAFHPVAAEVLMR